MNNFITLEIIGINEDKNIKEMIGTKKKQRKERREEGEGASPKP